MNKRISYSNTSLKEDRQNNKLNIPEISSESWKKVADGGMLLHKLPWQIGNTFLSILDSYVEHVDGMGKGIHIIFDGQL